MKRSALLRTVGASGAAAALVLAAPLSASAIVGGGDATQNYSFAISLQQNGNHVCGASLISADWAVTAAHCVAGHTAADFTVRVGSASRSSGGETSAVSQIISHPNYNTTYDIALLHLAQPVQATPIKIADSAPAGTAARLLGWGQTTPQQGTDSGPDQLKELDTSLVSSGCAAGFDSGTDLCVDNPKDANDNNQGACYGDSGGPAITQVNGEWRLIGATSRGGDDGTTCTVSPSIYTNVTAFKDFIQSNTGIGS